MVLTPSMMTKLGSSAPDFKLKDVVSGKEFSLASLAGKKALLVMFICRHCPYVQHIKDELSRLDRDYRTKDVALVSISSNDAANYPDDAPASLKEFAQAQGWQHPFLYDETQNVAKAYQAACTPDFFLYAHKCGTGGFETRPYELVYRGQLDDSRPGNNKSLTGKDLRSALDAVLTGRPVAAEQRPSVGCNIKWKKGSQPAYFGSA